MRASQLHEADFFSRLLLGLLMLFVLSSAVNMVQAETVKVNGVSFQVDYINEIDARTLQVSISGREKLIRKGDLISYVARTILADSDTDLSAGDLKRFISNGLINQDSKSTVLAFQRLFKKGIADRELADFIENVAVKPDAVPVFQSVLKQEQNMAEFPLSAARVMFVVGMKDVSKLRSSAPGLIYKLRTELLDYSEGVFYRRFQRDGITETGKIIDFLKKLYGPENATVQKLVLMRTRLGRFFKAVEEVNYRTIYSQMQIIKGDVKLDRNLVAVLRDEIHGVTAFLLDKKEYTQALSVLSLVEADWRTPETVRLAYECLRVQSVTAELFDKPSREKSFLVFLSKKDDSIKGAVVSFLQRRVFHLSGSEQFKLIEDVFSTLLELRPDPNLENDRIRVHLAIQGHRVGDGKRSDKYLAEIQTDLSYYDYLKMFLAGMYINLLAALLLLIAVLLIISLRWKVSRNISDFDISHLDRLSQQEEDGDSIFSKMGVKGLDPKYHTYLACLDKLGLKKKANLDDIKSTYRSLVKEVHPDLNKNLSPQERNRFIELTKAYQIVLDLRTELNLGKKDKRAGQGTED